MKRQIQVGKTDYTVLVFIPDPAATDGGGKTGLVAADLTVSYTRVETDNDVVLTDATSSLNNLSTLTDNHADWGLKEVSNTLAPGLYRLDIADAVFAANAWTAVVYVMITSSAAAPSPMEFILVTHDPDDLGTKQSGDAFARIGSNGASLTAIPWNAAWDAEVESEATDALVAYDPPTEAEMNARTLAAASYATPTNITAGTITTVTNLTNAPTNGDFTATMKASINTEADTALADYDGPTNAELNARTLPTASYATATAQTTAQGVLDKVDDTLEDDGGTFRFTANALEQAPTGSAPSAATIADAVWDEALAGHATAGSAGAALSAAGAAGDPWAISLPGAYGAGTAGKIVGDNLNATVGSRASQTSVDDIPTNAEFASGIGTRASQTSVDDLPTNAELATALASADDATLLAIADLPTNAELATALGDVPTAAENADALLDRHLAGGSNATGSQARSVRNALRSIRNRSEIVSNTLSVYEENDTTLAWSAATTTTPGDPLSAIDPA